MTPMNVEMDRGTSMTIPNERQNDLEGVHFQSNANLLISTKTSFDDIATN